MMKILPLLSTADIVLDTFPFNGHTSSYHCLWMGLPVVTLAGNVHRARMGATMTAVSATSPTKTSAPMRAPPVSRILHVITQTHFGVTQRGGLTIRIGVPARNAATSSTASL